MHRVILLAVASTTFAAPTPAQVTAAAAPPPGVTAPALASGEVRARLSRLIAGQPEPADATALDALLAADDGAALMRRLGGARDASQVDLDLNWERARLFDGAGFLIADAYLTDLWRTGVSTPGPAGDQLRQSAALFLVYAIDLIRLDGVRCADRSAPGHRQDQLFAQNQPLIAYLQTLPRATRMTIGSLSLAWESATASRRRDDPVLCGDGLDAIAAGLAAPGAQLKAVPNAPGTVGRSFAVPPAPGYRPGFVAPTVWAVRQAELRRQLPGILTTFLTVPADRVGMPPPTR